MCDWSLECSRWIVESAQHELLVETKQLSLALRGIVVRIGDFEKAPSLIVLLGCINLLGLNTWQAEVERKGQIVAQGIASKAE